MVSQSDNNACNWLIYFVGGIQNVNAFIKDLGIDQIRLIETEKSMEQDIRKNYNNWSTPLSVAQLLRKVYTEKVLSDKHFAFLEKAMLHARRREMLPGCFGQRFERIRCSKCKNHGRHRQ